MRAHQGPLPAAQAPLTYREQWARWRSDAVERTWAWEPPLNRATRVWFPLLALCVGLLIAVWQTGDALKTGMFLVVYHSPFGMYTGATAGVAMGMKLGTVVYVVALLHLFGGLFVTWNADALRSMPWLGRKIRRMEARGQAKWETNPRLRDLSVVGVGVFTAAPVPGTGLITGALVGRLMGLPWFPTFVAVVVGGMVRVTTITMIVYGVWGFTSWG